jgi:hypothetical protein
MSCVLYYSNYCDNSRKLIATIAKSKIKEEIHFVCIDERMTGSDGNTYIVYKNMGTSILLPPTITHVPALLLLRDGFETLFGYKILTHLQPREKEITSIATNNNMEPEAFLFNEMGGSEDKYSYLDTSVEDLKAKGDGGMRMMHRYATIGHVDTIDTPDDTYKSDTIGDDISVEKLMEQRNKEVPLPPVAL